MSQSYRSDVRLYVWLQEAETTFFPHYRSRDGPLTAAPNCRFLPSRIAASGSWALAQNRKFAKGQDRSRLGAVCKALNSIGGSYEVELLPGI